MEASTIKVVDGSNRLGLSVETTAVRPSNKNLVNSAILSVFDRFRHFFFCQKVDQMLSDFILRPDFESFHAGETF